MNLLTNSLLSEILEYLPCRDICKVLISNKNICRQLVSNSEELKLSIFELIELKMNNIIYNIYYNLYKEIIPLKINTILATQLTIRDITKNKLKYSCYKTNVFSSEAIIIRNILLGEVYHLIPEKERMICSIYYILYREPQSPVPNPQTPGVLRGPG